jgi:16S rRNA (uracil1498-N3)-methyltransferase
VSNPVFHCPDLVDDEVVLAGAEGRHAAVVRRVRAGEEVDLVDGRGTRCTGTVVATTRDSVTVAVRSRVVEPPPAPRITLVQAIAKGDRGELAVELATEVGVDVVVPWRAARCVARWEGDRGDKHVERWRATAREAGKQSRRARFPEVLEPLATAEVAALPGTLLVLHEEASVALTQVPLAGDVVLVVGPEGGIGADELAVLLSGGGTAVRLGETVLRTSTAGAAAAAVVSARTGRW